MRKKPTIKELIACRSVAAIVRLMKKYRIKGRRWDACDCPLANFAKLAGVSDPRVKAGECEDYFDGRVVFKESKARRRFVQMFDAYAIPELVS